MKISSGFTLIELVAVLGVLSILTIISIASLRSYNTDQLLDTSVADVEALLLTARSKAISGVKPPECVNQSLIGYQLQIVPDASYRLEAVCIDNTVLIEEKTLPEGITFFSQQTVLFNAVSGTLAEPVVVSLTDDGDLYEVLSLSSSGTIDHLSDQQQEEREATATLTPTPTQSEPTATPTPVATCSKNYSCFYFFGCIRTVTGGGNYCTATCDNAC